MCKGYLQGGLPLASLKPRSFMMHMGWGGRHGNGYGIWDAWRMVHMVHMACMTRVSSACQWSFRSPQGLTKIP
jgi:hypothetical protein